MSCGWACSLVEHWLFRPAGSVDRLVPSWFAGEWEHGLVGSSGLGTLLGPEGTGVHAPGLLGQDPLWGFLRCRLIWSPYHTVRFVGGGLVVAGGWFCPCFENCIVDASIFVLVECVQVF